MLNKDIKKKIITNFQQNIIAISTVCGRKARKKASTMLNTTNVCVRKKYFYLCIFLTYYQHNYVTASVLFLYFIKCTPAEYKFLVVLNNVVVSYFLCIL